MSQLFSRRNAVPLKKEKFRFGEELGPRSFFADCESLSDLQFGALTG